MHVPTNTEEYLELLEAEGVDPKYWILPDVPFSRTDVVSFMFLRTIWKTIDRGDEVIYQREWIDARKADWAKNPDIYQPPLLHLIDKLLDLGVSPEDIRKLRKGAQIWFAGVLCEFLENPHADWPDIEDDCIWKICDFYDDDQCGSRLILLNESLSEARSLANREDPKDEVL